MLGLAPNTNATSKIGATGKKPAATTAFTMQGLWRLALWGSTAAVALLIATLTTRSDIGSQRASVLLSSAQSGRQGQATTQVASQSPARQFDAEAATRQLAQVVRNLTEDRDRLAARLAAVEHNMDDMTGSITKQIEAVKAKTAEALPPAPSPWPGDSPPVAMTPATIAALVAPVAPASAGFTAPPLPSSLATAADLASSGAPPTAYGVDVGSALSIQALRARWTAIHLAHAPLFDGLYPVVMLKEIPKANRVELRLVVGPLTSPEAAAQLCASLAAFKLFCQPTSFDGQHLALQ